MILKNEKEIMENKKGKAKKKLRILAAGDIHGDANLSKKLAEKATKEKVDLIVLTGDLIGINPTKNIIQPFIDRGQKVIFVPGNWESKEDVKNLIKQYKIKNLGEHYLKYKGVGFFGLGNEDWALYLDDEKSLKHLKKDFDKIKNLEKTIMVSHSHAAGTKSELSGIPGSEGLRKAIKKFQPDFFLHSHIHELEGIEEKLGKTKIINVGRKGKIIEI